MKPLVFSYTLLRDADTCLRLVEHKHVLRDLPKEVASEAMKWGIRVHEALEKRLYGDPLPDAMKRWDHLCVQLDAKKPTPEMKVGINAKGEARGFFDEDVWLRGKIDVTVAFGDTAVLFDWKTGKRYENPDELEIHAVLLKARHPQLRMITGHYVWLKDDAVGKPHDLSSTDAKLEEIYARANVVKFAIEKGYFPPQQNPLCGWCPVKTCEFNTNKGR